MGRSPGLGRLGRLGSTRQPLGSSAALLGSTRQLGSQGSGHGHIATTVHTTPARVGRGCGSKPSWALSAGLPRRLPRLHAMRPSTTLPSRAREEEEEGAGWQQLGSADAGGGTCTTTPEARRRAHSAPSALKMPTLNPGPQPGQRGAGPGYASPGSRRCANSPCWEAHARFSRAKTHAHDPTTVARALHSGAATSRRPAMPTVRVRVSALRA